MGIEACLIDQLTLTIVQGERRTLCYLDKDVSSTLFDDIIMLFDNNFLRRVEMSNTAQDLTMCLFCEKNKYHIGVVDIYNDINYYYDNGSNDTSLVAIDGEVFEKRTMGTNKDLLWNIVRTFVQKGELSKEVNWIEE